MGAQVSDYVFVEARKSEPSIHTGSNTMSCAAAKRRASRRGAFAGLRRVCFTRPSSEDLLSVKTVTFDEDQIRPQVL